MPAKYGGIVAVAAIDNADDVTKVDFTRLHTESQRQTFNRDCGAAKLRWAGENAARLLTHTVIPLRVS